MQRDLLKARLARLPEFAPPDQALTDSGSDADELEELDDFPSEPKPRSFPTPRKRPGKEYSPKTAEGYFSSALEVDVDGGTFRVYYSPLSMKASSPDHDSTSLYALTPVDLDAPGRAPWAKAIPTLPGSSGKGVVFVCVHGAGYSALSFACFAQAVVAKGGGRAGVLAYDARGHGKSHIREQVDSTVDMSVGTLAEDLLKVVRSIFPDPQDAPPLVLLGHSMGGAVAVQGCPQIISEGYTVAGIAVIDVVEGTAMEALSGMSSLIESQPKGFDSVEQGIEWHIRSKTLNNLDSARLSVPPLLRASKQEDQSSYAHVWRADLSRTQPFWEGWFKGLSSKFLACKTAKMLLLAGADRLDKDLMIGQMQGKFQLEVFPDVGHCVQEDAPERTAELLLSFWARNDRTDILAGVKKVGQR